MNKQRRKGRSQCHVFMCSQLLPTTISTRKKAKVRLNMLTSLHFFPEYLPSPRPSPAPIVIGWTRNRLCDIHFRADPQEVSKVLLTVFSCSGLLLCNNTGRGSMQSTWPSLAIFTSSRLTVCTQVASHVSLIIAALKSHTGCIIHTSPISSS